MKTDKDVCLKCGQRGHWAKNCPNPAKAIHGLDGQNDANNGWWQWNDSQEWKAPSEQSTAESQRAAPTQPMAGPEAAMGGLWLASVTVASVAKNLLSVSSLLKTGHEVVFSSGKSYIRHLKTGARQPMVEKNGVFEVSYDLSPYAVGLKPPPRLDE